jgi:aspartyl-tRNA(Asn)/glutamyl-tRNA(Gln) amidotransferase subunit C
MSRISPEEVEHVAQLAKLALTPEERESVAGHLDRILDYVDVLQQLDTEGVEPTFHAIPVPTPLREDVATEPLDPELAMSNAPERAGTAFVVPKVIDEG